MMIHFKPFLEDSFLIIDWSWSFIEIIEAEVTGIDWTWNTALKYSIGCSKMIMKKFWADLEFLKWMMFFEMINALE